MQNTLDPALVRELLIKVAKGEAKVDPRLLYLITARRRPRLMLSRLCSSGGP